MSGVLLIVDLTALPWHHYALNIDTKGLDLKLPTFSLDRTAVQAPHAFLGVAALLLAAVMVVLVALSTLRQLGSRFETLHLIIGPAVFGLLAAKAMVADYLGAGAWLGLLLGAMLAYGGFRVSQEAGRGTGAPTGRRAGGAAGPG